MNAIPAWQHMACLFNRNMTTQAARTHEQVGGLDVPVEDASLVHGSHTPRNIQRQAYHLTPPWPPPLQCRSTPFHA